MDNLPFFVVNGLVATVLIGALVAGIRRWRTVGGKIATIVVGLLLTAHLAFLALVAIIVISGHAGHPF